MFAKFCEAMQKSDAICALGSDSLDFRDDILRQSNL